MRGMATHSSHTLRNISQSASAKSSIKTSVHKEMSPYTLTATAVLYPNDEALLACSDRRSLRFGPPPSPAHGNNEFYRRHLLKSNCTNTNITPSSLLSRAVNVTPLMIPVCPSSAGGSRDDVYQHSIHAAQKPPSNPEEMFSCDSCVQTTVIPPEQQNIECGAAISATTVNRSAIRLRLRPPRRADYNGGTTVSRARGALRIRPHRSDNND
jgi:hypothetical protein